MDDPSGDTAVDSRVNWADVVRDLHGLKLRSLVSTSRISVVR